MKAKVYKYQSLGDCDCYLCPPFYPPNHPDCFRCPGAYKFTVKKVVMNGKFRLYINNEVKG